MDNDNIMQHFADNCWKDVFEKAENAAVYLDHASAECVHWYKGDKAILAFKEAGAISVQELAMYNFRNVRVKEARKAVFICTSTDPFFYQRTLRTIIDKNTFEKCTVVCAAHSNVFNCNLNRTTKEAYSYDKLEQDVLRWMNSKDSDELAEEPIVEILFRPIFTASINENVFVTPPFGGLMPPISTDEFSEEFGVEVEHLVSSLHSMFTNFNVKEDIYTMGNFSEHIAEKLENLPAAIDRRKRLVGQAGVSLILVDRTLDLCTATSHNTESLLGRMLSTLPRLPHHLNDVAINMSPICPEGEVVCDVSISMAPGCLASDDSNMMNLLITKKQKEVLLTLHKLLVDMSISKESPKTRVTTRVSAHSLEKLVNKFKDIEDIQCFANSSKKLEQIIAVIQALKSDKTAQIELLISLEKLILQNLAVSRDSSSVLAQLSNIVRTRVSRGLGTENLLALLLHIYALAGTEINLPEQQERQLKDALADAIYEDIKNCNDGIREHEMSIYHQTLQLLGVTDDNTAKESAEKISKDIMEKLHAIGGMRQCLKKYKSLMTKPSPQEMAHCVGILQQLVTDLLNPNKPEIPDLQCQTSSLLSAGFNLLMKGRTKQHPTDNPWIIIYVLGGITAEETRIVQDIMSSQRSDCRVTLAGTRLLSPLDTVDKILLSNVGI